MSWKQIIPTSVYEDFGNDYAAMNIYIHGLLRARSEDMQKPEYYKGKPYILKRGQFIYGRNEFAKYVNMSPSGTDKALMRIQEVTSKITIERTKDYSIITILNYDEVTSIETKSNKRVASKWQASDTNQHDKHDKVIFINKYNYKSQFPEEIEEVIREFKKHRSKLRKPLTEKAEELLRKKIEKKLESLGKEKIVALFELAIERGWQGVFYDDPPPAPPPKEQKIDHRQLATLQFIQENS